MPSLRDIQRGMTAAIADGDLASVAAHIVPSEIAPDARLAIYRNTHEFTLARALALAFPAVERIVGTEFFAGAARRFARANKPHGAWLDDYGASFPGYLARMTEAAFLAYLPDVARLEWSVNVALHAPDAGPIDLAAIAALDPADHPRVRFAPHPALSLLALDHPADAIWRAVLAEDDAALAAIDIAGAPVRLVVERTETGVDVTRLDEAAWRYLEDLAAGHTLGEAIAAHPAVDAPNALAGHLAHARFAGFDLAPDPSEAP